MTFRKLKNGIEYTKPVPERNKADVKCKCCGYINKTTFADDAEFIKCPGCGVKFFLNQDNDRY